ncbi:MAG: sigma-54 dependent transcriptional regulator [Gammaproteobacteria bacterium]|nr:sigma-54 dependent transcriptional regulator [Gammaproteobacteria bacterium]
MGFTHVHKILVVDSDIEFAETVLEPLMEEQFDVKHVRKVDNAVDMLLSEHFDLVLSDLNMNGQSGLDLLRKVRSEKLECPIIIYTSYTSIKCAAQALRLGAADYILRPFTDSYLLHAVVRVINERSIKKENKNLKRDLDVALRQKREIIGESQSMIELKSLITRVGPCEATVLIQGESGTGKELVAQAIHRASPRREGRFVAVNCGAIPKELMESEFFGHAKGAYTGATNETEGLIRQANGGTLFLDEIAELDLSLQVKLLRVIEERIVRPVGSNKDYNVDIRIIAAGNRDLHYEVSKGKMREDLYYRLNVVQILVPPLRKRANDLVLLVDHFIEMHNKKLGRKVNSANNELIEYLMEYEWPGNIRELENSIERAIILATDDELKIKDFKHIRSHHASNLNSTLSDESEIAPMSIEEFTKKIVKDYQHEYSEQQLASLLGIGRKALWMRRNRWGLYRTKKSASQNYQD